MSAIHGKGDTCELIARQTRNLWSAIPKAQVGLAPKKVGGACAGHKLNLRALPLFNKIADVARDESARPGARRDPYNGADTFRSAPAIDLQCIQFNGFGKVEKILAGTRKFVAVPLANEKLSAQALLQRGHPAPQSRRTYSDCPCRTGKPPGACDSQKQP